MIIETSTFNKLKYAAVTPDNLEPGRKYPAIVFLHGAGSRGETFDILLGNTITEYFMNNNPEIILAEPLCPTDTWYEVYEQLTDFIDYFRQLDYIDPDRVCLTGNSLGGYACWQMAMSHPDWFSCAVPVCGGGMTWNAPRLKDLRIHAFHGMLDPVVPVEETVKMVNAVNAAGGKAEMTLYPGAFHDSWTETYSNPELYDWIIQQKKVSVETQTEKLKGAQFG